MNKRLQHIKDPHRRVLRMRRMEMLMNIKEMADLVGVSVNTIINWENGRTQPKDIKILRKYGKALGLSLVEVYDAVYGGEDAKG